MDEKTKDWTESEDLLQDLFSKHNKYFTAEKYTTPTSRYEAWLMANTLSNLMVAKALKDLSTQIFQKLENYNKIEPEEIQKPIKEVPLKRRGK